MFQAIDLYLLHALNGFAGESYALDRTVVSLTNIHLFKTAPLLLPFLWFWFSPARDGHHPNDEAGNDRHFLIFSGLAGAVLACGLSRLVQNAMWERPRPINEPAIEIRRPLGLEEDYLVNFSSFPSDNAAMTFGLAMGVFLISRRVGLLAFAWALVVACLPRVFAGFHYPSDILGGAILGIAAVWLLARCEVLRAPYHLAIRVHDRMPGLFYASAFIALYQIVTFFGDARDLGAKVQSFIQVVDAGAPAAGPPGPGQETLPLGGAKASGS